MTNQDWSPEGFHCSNPVSFQAVRFPNAATLALFEEFGLSTFDVSQIARRLMSALSPTAEVRLFRLPPGVGLEWGRQLALSMLNEDGLAVGKLDGAPCVFAHPLEAPGLRELHQELKDLYRQERDNLRINQEVYPGASRLLADRLPAFLGRVVEPVRLLDLGTGAGGIAPFLKDLPVKGKLLKIDTDVVALAVLKERFRQHPHLKTLGVEESIERLREPEFRERIVSILGGRPSAVLCAFVLNLFEELCYETAFEEWLQHLRRVVAPGGHLLLADFYYPHDVTDADFHSSEQANLRRLEQHPNLKIEAFSLGIREAYKQPEELQALLQVRGFAHFEIHSAPVYEDSPERFFILEATHAPAAC